MKHWIVGTLWLLLAGTLLGCSALAPKPTPTPQPTATLVPPTATTAPTATSVPKPTVAPTATQVPPSATATRAPAAPTLGAAAGVATSVPVAPTAPAVPAANYNGEWQGKAENYSVAFTIEENQMTNLNVSYNGNAGACRALSLFYSNSVENAPIKGKDVNAQLAFRDGALVTLGGTFGSNAEAAGTMIFKGKFEGCGEYEVKVAWTAKRGAASTAPVAPTAPASNAGTPDEDAQKILRAFFAAINAKSLDTALALVDDDVVFNIGGNNGIGKDSFKSFWQNQINRGVTITISNVTESFGSLMFSLQLGSNSTSNNMVEVEDGKIIIMMLR